MSQFSRKIQIAKLILVILSATAITSSSSLSQRKYMFLVNQVGFKLQGVDDKRTFVAPKGSRFEILDESQNKFVVRFDDIPSAQAVSMSELSFGSFSIDGDLARFPPVQTDVNYEILQAAVPRYNYQLRFGLDYGALTVPFKLQHDGALTAGATVGAYIGWKQHWLGPLTTILGTAGFSIIPVQDVNASSVETKIGITIAGGLVAEPARQFQIGIIAGIDHLGIERYKYENKLWISFGIGFGFIQ